MKHPLSSKKLLAVGLLFIVSITQTFEQVTQRDTLLTWSHFEYALNENNGMGSYSTSNIVEEQYPGVVIENEFVRLVILPEFGARIISLCYKPSGHEQLYINPVGTPYGMGDGNFYYDWLMVFGGIFPTFPEPEHGKTWFLPWQWEFTQLSEEVISLSMELQDTINYPFHPGKFNNGITQVRCTSTVTLHRGKTSFEFTHNLENTKAVTVPFEYWTSCTLAPGSVPGNTFVPGNSEIIVPIDYVYLKDDWWSWMGNAEVAAPGQGSHVFNYKNLAIYDNWEDMGIAYAHPYLEANYYGVINHENSEGFFRVADNSAITKGMKFWTWGAQQGLNADPQNFYQVARPYIELWSGLSTQFFEDASLSPYQTLSWKETYLPTLAMDSISYVNENGAIHLNYANNPDRFIVKIFSTTPGNEFNLNLSLKGLPVNDLADIDFISDSEASNQFTVYLDNYMIEDGEYALIAKVYNQGGEKVIETSIPVTVPLPSQGITDDNQPLPKLFRLADNIYRIDFLNAAERTIDVFSINGQFVDRKDIHDHEAFIKMEIAGIYIIRISEDSRSYSLKIIM